MDYVLNDRTQTVHRPSKDESRTLVNCGALTQIPHQRIQRVPEQEIEIEGEITRCGRCFEGEGGY